MRRYTRSLSFDQEPDVSKYRKIFKRLYDEKGYSTEPYLWDWDPPATVVCRLLITDHLLLAVISFSMKPQAAATSGFSSKRKNNPLPDSEFARHGKNYEGACCLFIQSIHVVIIKFAWLLFQKPI